MSKLVRQHGTDRASILYRCNECRKQFITSIDELGRSEVCPRCRSRVDTLPVRCHYEGCLGRYRKCDGTIRRLSADELAIEEGKASAWAPSGAVGPTDGNHDDWGEFRSSLTAYRCDGCGDSFNAAYGVSHGLASGTVRCGRVSCDSCKRFPAVGELPEPEDGWEWRLGA
jgi:DNA-directed RNA polymerase subunit RPC12/RpoP